MELLIDFPGGSRVDAHFGSFMVQPTNFRQTPRRRRSMCSFLRSGHAPVFTCWVFAMLGFHQQRGLSTDGIQMIERAIRNPSGAMVEKSISRSNCRRAFRRNIARR